MENSFLSDPADALDYFNVSEHAGLSQSAVIESRKKHGPNGKDCPILAGMRFCILIAP